MQKDMLRFRLDGMAIQAYNAQQWVELILLSNDKSNIENELSIANRDLRIFADALFADSLAYHRNFLFFKYPFVSNQIGEARVTADKIARNFDDITRYYHENNTISQDDLAYISKVNDALESFWGSLLDENLKLTERASTKGHLQNVLDEFSNEFRLVKY
jgi:hypothetical protein